MSTVSLGALAGRRAPDTVAAVSTSAADDAGTELTFQDEVWLWLEVWTADRPALRAEARRRADPSVDPWGYLAHLGELILAED